MSENQPKALTYATALRATAPVSEFKIQLIDGVNGPVAVGYAAPKSGQFACAVALTAGGETLELDKAARYSTDAAKVGLRFGWCGFRVDGLELAAVLDDSVELRCATSAKLLAEWPSMDLLLKSSPKPQKPFLLVNELRVVIRSAYGCTEPHHLKAFAERFRQSRGDNALVAATYRWLLKRTPSPEEISGMINVMGHGWDFLTIVKHVCNSEEYNLVKELISFGPFEPSFPFDLEAVWP